MALTFIKQKNDYKNTLDVRVKYKHELTDVFKDYSVPVNDKALIESILKGMKESLSELKEEGEIYSVYYYDEEGIMFEVVQS